MKTWHVVLLVSAVALVGIVVLMKSSQAKATPVNTGQGTGGFSAQGLAALVGVGLSVYDRFGNKPRNEGTYQTGIVPIQQGNTLVDPNTGSTLVYGTD